MAVKVIVVAALICAVNCKPLDADNDIAASGHELWKRFVNPSPMYGDFADNGLNKIRTKRSLEEECEKLQLCKLHARSRYSFFAAYELYFVNKENAKLWDHQARSVAECENRFSGCYR
ncbi:unnamed protein product [Parnassius apollo]|uniref:(apollo) hypothetical protein n=1 Tax=Parnassius apollo TaxID=110799 RepID=A0A8S3WCC2_PARAO|nr:unnamed protein product [Parnassius apollo]